MVKPFLQAMNFVVAVYLFGVAACCLDRVWTTSYKQYILYVLKKQELS